MYYACIYWMTNPNGANSVSLSQRLSVIVVFEVEKKNLIFIKGPSKFGNLHYYFFYIILIPRKASTGIL